MRPDRAVEILCARAGPLPARLHIPHGELTLVTGPSGSGKSMLTRSALQAESDYRGDALRSRDARHQSRPAYATVRGLRTVRTIAADAPAPKLTVAEYLGLTAELLAWIRTDYTPACPRCGAPMRELPSEQAVAELLDREQGRPAAVMVALHSRDGSSGAVEALRRSGIERIYIDRERNGHPPLPAGAAPVEALVDRVDLRIEERARLIDTFLLVRGIPGAAIVVRGDGPGEALFHWALGPHCTDCGGMLEPLAHADIPLLLDAAALRAPVPPALEHWLRAGNPPLRDRLTAPLPDISAPTHPLLEDTAAALRQASLGHCTLGVTLQSLSPPQWLRIQLTRTALRPAPGEIVIIEEPTLGVPSTGEAGLETLLRRIIEAQMTAIVVQSDPTEWQTAGRRISMGAETIVPIPPRAARTSAWETADLGGLSIVRGGITALRGERDDRTRALLTAAIEAGAPAVLVPFSTPTRSQKPALDLIGLSKPLARLYAALPLARMRGYTERTFLVAAIERGSGCERCGGSGIETSEFLAGFDPYHRCLDCAGRRYSAAIREVLLRGSSIGDLMVSSFGERLETLKLLRGGAGALDRMTELGLNVLKIGQPLASLSSGERGRLEIVRAYTGLKEPTTVVLDLPCRGLAPTQIEELLRYLRSECARGHSVVCIESNPHFTAGCDTVIDP